jgi:hypothetical protein
MGTAIPEMLKPAAQGGEALIVLPSEIMNLPSSPL